MPCFTPEPNIGERDSTSTSKFIVCGTVTVAESMAEKSPVALEIAKKAVKASSRMELEQGIEYEAELFTTLFSTEDKNEGIDAFFEDRDPEWEGR